MSSDVLLDVLRRAIASIIVMKFPVFIMSDTRKHSRFVAANATHQCLGQCYNGPLSGYPARFLHQSRPLWLEVVTMPAVGHEIPYEDIGFSGKHFIQFLYATWTLDY